jgi:hypothetical protein
MPSVRTARGRVLFCNPQIAERRSNAPTHCVTLRIWPHRPMIPVSQPSRLVAHAGLSESNASIHGWRALVVRLSLVSLSLESQKLLLLKWSEVYDLDVSISSVFQCKIDVHAW